MISPASSESAFAALFLLLSKTLVNGKPFVTTSRKLPAIANVSGGVQPALFALEAEEDVRENEQGLPVEEMKVAYVALFKTGDVPVPSSLVNAYRDALINQLRTFTLRNGQVVPMQPGSRQTLGGVVVHCRVQGKVLKNEGLQNGQGAIVLPISILTGL